MTIENAQVADAPTNITPVVGGGELLNMGLSMAIVVAVIVLLGWIYSRSRMVGGGSANIINVVATRALGPKERLLVVEVADRQLLVGMTAGSVQTLHVFDEPVCETKAVADGPGFAMRLKSALQEIRK